MLSNGDRLGLYEILSPLGAGGMGEVYLAKDTTLGREVAIKVLPADVASSPERLQRFEREAKTVAALNHPNIVTIFGIEASGGHRFIAMELVEGETLDRMIAPGGMPLAKIFDIAIPLADALAAAHDKGIVHRDLKPANVMVTREGRVKVLDFGLAKLTAGGQSGSSQDDVTMSAPLTGRGVVIGTVPYMSPEQLQGETVDNRTDLFSLGILLYEMATGQRPFKGKNSATITSSILRDTPRPLHELNGVLPRHLGRIIEHCLEKDPEHRTQSAKDVRNELRALRKEIDSGSDLSESQSVTTPTSVVPPPSTASSTSLSGSAMSAPTRRGEFWIGVGVLAVVIATAAWWLGRGVDSTERIAATNEPSRTTPTAPGKPAVLQDSPARQKGEATLAILPFENISNDSDTDYLSNEIPANIIDKLSGLSGLNVISRSGAFRFDPVREDASSFGRSLGASVVLTGQLNAHGESLTIRAELVDVATNQQLWSKRYPRELTDIMAVEADITQSISEALRLQLTQEEKQELAKSYTKNAEAHRALLEGRFWFQKFTMTGWRRALGHFQDAVRIDPAYALAYAELSRAYSGLGIWFGDMPPDEAAPKAKQAALTAIALDDSLGEAHGALAFNRLFYDWDWPGAEEEFIRAIRLAPESSRLHLHYTILLRLMGRLREAEETMKVALLLDPTFPMNFADLAMVYKDMGLYEEAIAQCRKALDLDPDFPPAYLALGNIYLAKGAYDEAISHFERNSSLRNRQTMDLGHLGSAYALAGKRSKAMAVLDELRGVSSKGRGQVSAAMIHTSLGSVDTAFASLEEAFEQRDAALIWVNTELQFDPLRGDPRFDELVRRMGFEPRKAAPGAEFGAADVTKAKRSLAVMPFENRNADEDAAYLADEIPASIINRLSQVSGLRVIPRSTVFSLRDLKLTHQELARRLNVQTLLTGQVSHRGNQLSVRAELIDLESDTQIWGERFTKTAEEWLTVEEEIAQKISESLELKLTGAERAQFTKRHTENSAAYRAYLQGRFWWNKRSAKGFDKAIEHFQQAIEHDPNYALALAGLADTHILLGLYQIVLPNDAFREARRAAQAALRIDETLAEAHVSLGGVQTFFDWDTDSAQESFIRAIEINPKYPTAHQWSAWASLIAGDLPLALGAMEKAHDLDPLASIISTNLASLMRFGGRYGEAESLLRQVLELDVSFAGAHQELGVLFLETGRLEEGVAELETANRLTSGSGFYAGALGAAYVQLGRTRDARNLLADLQERSRTAYVSPVAIASIQACLGETSEAFASMEQALDSRDPGFLITIVNPSLEQLLSEPHMAELVRRSGYKPIRKPPVLKRLQPRKLMLAVLPFENLSRDPDQEYFSDGMTEEMITTLGRLSPEKLGVIARTSAMRYKGANKGIDEIGRELSVGYVVEGSIRRAADRVRITAKLIQVSDQTLMWSGSYERDLADVFKIQVEVAEAVAEALAVELLPAQKIARSKTPTESAAAYDAYLLGRSYWAKRTPESLRTAIKHFKHAIELDPSYALAYCGLADAWSVMPWYVPGPYNKINAEAMKAAERALALNDSLAEAHVSMACVLADGGDWKTANEHYQKAVGIDPNNATAHQWYGGTLSIQGRFDQATEEFEKAITLDPLSAVMHNEYGDGSVIARRFDKAIEQLNKAIRLQSNFKIANYSLTWAYIGKEDHDAAAKAFESYLRVIDQPAESITKFRRTYDASGLRAGFLEWLDSLGNDSNSKGIGPERRAPLYAWCNEKDRAFEWLERAVQQQDPNLLQVERSHAYDNLRDDPRYAELLKRIGAKRMSERNQPKP